jgi:chitinase
MIRSSHVWILRLIACAAGVVALAPSSASIAEESKPRVFVGYLFGSADNINFKLYTHLCHAFVVADESGQLKPNRRVPSRGLIADAHRAGVKVLLSLGGWGWDRQFAAIVADSEAENRYVDAVMQLVDDFDYDGVDLDWEYPDAADEVAGFERLARRLRGQLDELAKRKGRPMALTMAASASPATLKWLDAGFLLETMDWIHVMTYDYAGPWSRSAAHHAPLFASSKLPAADAQSIELTMKFLVNERRLPPERLVVGLPLYGRGFSAAQPYAPVKGPAPERTGGNYARLHSLQSRDGWRRVWDDQTKSPWLVSAEGVVIGYDDPQSLALKTDWTMQQGFRGVFFWQIAGDRMPDGGNPLQAAARQRWEAATRPRGR